MISVLNIETNALPCPISSSEKNGKLWVSSLESACGVQDDRKAVVFVLPNSISQKTCIRNAESVRYTRTRKAHPCAFQEEVSVDSKHPGVKHLGRSSRVPLL